jgi:superfamily I DNA/RNA helicase/RecB family exonuclease
MVLEPSQEKVLTKLDPAQAEAVTSLAGPTVVLGEPGTGKTAVVVERAAHLVASGVSKDRILVVGLSRRSMAELTSRLVGRLGTDAPVVTTLHSLALGLVRRHYREAGYRRPPRSLAGQEPWRHLKAALEHEDPTDWPRYGNMLRSQTLLAMANDLVAGSAHNALEGAEIQDRIAQCGREDLSEMVRFLGRYLRQLKEHGLADLQWALVEALRLLENHPEILVGHRDRYPHLLVDEFEDASFTQARLAQLLGGNGLFAAGNPEQAINSFQGGSPAHLRKLAASAEVRVFRLTTCHRSTAAIHRACRGLWEQGASPEDADPSDAVSLHTFAHQGEEPIWIAREILSLLRSGIGPEQVAVLFRSGKDPVARELSRRLIHMGIPIRSLVDSQSVAADPLVGSAVELLRYLAVPAEGRETLLAGLLTSPLAGLTPAELRSLRRAAGKMGISLTEVAAAPSALETLPPLVADAVVSFASRLASLEAHLTDPPTELLWRIWTTFPVYAVQAVAWGERRLGDVVGSPAAYRAFLEEAGQIARDTPSTTIAGLVGLYDAGHFKDVATGGRDAGSGVTITTIHQARGREWDFVFMPNLVDGVYPLRRSPIGTLAPLLLRREEGEPQGIRERHLAEERRLLLVGLSRARRRVYLSHSATALDGTTRLTPSRYLSQLRAVVAEDGKGRSRGIEELLVHYRRQLLAEHPAARAQALYALGRLADAFPGRVDPLLWWDTQDETTGADHPYPEASLRLSASRLTAYRNCPLQFKFARHLSLEEISSDAMTLGTLIHDVLQAYHDPRADLPHTMETLESLLDRLFDPAAFSRPVVARQVRAKAGELLGLYFSKYGQATGVVDVERAFLFTLGPHTMSGRIDRIDRRPDGTLELIDYKTGSAMSYSDAATDIQLALYDLAFRHVPELAELGQPGKATYLYLKGIGVSADGKRSYEPTEEGREKLLGRIERYSNGILSETFPSRFRILETWPDLESEEVARVQKSDPCRTCSFGWLCPEMERGQDNE